MRKILPITLVFVLLGAGMTLAATANTSVTTTNAGKHQYGKPGCGPWKTDGVAGNSGRHIGQPPKDQNRGDCPPFDVCAHLASVHRQGFSSQNLGQIREWLGQWMQFLCNTQPGCEQQLGRSSQRYGATTFTWCHKQTSKKK